MTRLYPVVCALILLLVSLTLTGFQCSSSELTTAKLALNQNNVPKADTALTREVEKNPQDGEAWYLLGRVKLMQGDYGKMAEAFSKSLAVTKEFEPKIAEDRKYVWGKNLNEGVVQYNRSISAPPESAVTYRQKAVELYKNAILAIPDSAIAYQNLAVAQHALGNYDDEIANYRLAMARKNDPSLETGVINAYLMKAQQAKKAGNAQSTDENYNAAIAELTKSRMADPSNADLLGTLINVYIEAGKAADAMPLIKEAVEKDPRNKVYQNDLGLLLLQTNDVEGAIQHFDAAVTIDSAYDQALQNGAVAYMKMGAKMKEEADATAAKTKGNTDKSYVDKFKHAVVLLEKLDMVKPNDNGVLEALATAYGNAGNYKKAEETLKRADAAKKK